MKKIILLSILAISFAFIFTSYAAMPNNQCYKLANNIDNAVQNANPTPRTSYTCMNPCAGTNMAYDSYANYYDAPYVARKVFENGDVMGHKMNTRYWLCSDGRAKIENWALYYIKGMSYGVWFFHPLVDWTNYYKMEQCNTL